MRTYGLGSWAMIRAMRPMRVHLIRSALIWACGAECFSAASRNSQIYWPAMEKGASRYGQSHSLAEMVSVA